MPTQHSPLVLGLPGGSGYGWGTAGTELTKAIQALRPVVDLSLAPYAGSPYPHSFPAPMLQATQGASFLPMYPHAWSSRRNIGYCFIEENLLMRNYLANARRYWHTLVAGSTWAAEQLKNAGVEEVRTVIQGVDTEFYCPGERDSWLEDRFVVFSGGKFEYRKGQDIVMKAVSILMEKHRDVFLQTAWCNHWPASMETMNQSHLIEFKYLAPGMGGLGSILESWYQLIDRQGDCGYDFTWSNTPEQMRQLYRNADVGLFPNRCEAGTNLVMMEFMACGKPVIATYEHGHKDVTSTGCFGALEFSKPATISRDGQPVAEWFEPDLDEIVNKLEFAYENRSLAVGQGKYNRARMTHLTWERAAEQFVEILES